MVAMSSSLSSLVLAGWRRGVWNVNEQHSLRSPVTDHNFDFITADRFENGTITSDLGGLPADRMVSGFDPTARGF
jgi:hypothetical protein